MEERLPQDEDLSHLTTLASPVNTTHEHTVNTNSLFILLSPFLEALNKYIAIEK